MAGDAERERASEQGTRAEQQRRQRQRQRQPASQTRTPPFDSPDHIHSPSASHTSPHATTPACPRRENNTHPLHTLIHIYDTTLLRPPTPSTSHAPALTALRRQALSSRAPATTRNRRRSSLQMSCRPHLVLRPQSASSGILRLQHPRHQHLTAPPFHYPPTASSRSPTVSLPSPPMSSSSQHAQAASKSLSRAIRVL